MWLAGGEATPRTMGAHEARASKRGTKRKKSTASEEDDNTYT